MTERAQIRTSQVPATSRERDVLKQRMLALAVVSVTMFALTAGAAFACGDGEDGCTTIVVK